MTPQPFFIFFFCFEHLGDRVLVSGPEGAFSLRPLRDVTHLYLLAAGTGLTPMTRLISLATREMENIRQGPGGMFAGWSQPGQSGEERCGPSPAGSRQDCHVLLNSCLWI